MQAIRRALVLGATGHVGSAVVRALLRRDVQVTAASRRVSQTANLAGLDIALAPGDADDPGQIEEWAAGHDLVVDAAVPYPVWLFHGEEDPLGQARRRTRRVIAAARRHGARLAVVGSFTSLPHPGLERGEVEPALLRRAHPYFAVKDAVEAMVLAAARSGLPALVVNPTAFLGPWDYKARSMCFLPLALTGEVPVTTDRVVNFIDVRDAAEALVRAVLAGRFGERTALAGHNVRVSEVVELACSIHGVRPPRLRMPTRLGAALSYWAEASWATLGRRAPFPALPLLLLRYSYPMRPGAAQRRLGGALRPLSATLRDAIDWYSSIDYL